MEANEEQVTSLKERSMYAEEEQTSYSSRGATQTLRASAAYTESNAINAGKNVVKARSH
jgi:hypothetical protein